MEITLLLYKILVFGLFHFFVLLGLFITIKHIIDSKGKKTFPKNWQINDALYNCNYPEHNGLVDFYIRAISPDRKIIVCNRSLCGNWLYELKADLFFKTNKKNKRFKNHGLENRIQSKEQERLSENVEVWSYVNNILNE